MTQEVLKLALNALQAMQMYAAAEHQGLLIICNEATAATKAALAKPTSGDYALGYAEGFNDACKPKPAQQEPIGYAVPTFDFDNSVIKTVHYAGTVPLYTTPPQRPWVELAPEDRLCAKYMLDAPEGIEAVIDYITAKLKDKNT